MKSSLWIILAFALLERCPEVILKSQGQSEEISRIRSQFFQLLLYISLSLLIFAFSLKYEANVEEDKLGVFEVIKV